MPVDNSNIISSSRVRNTEILSTDTRQQYREKIARITLDSMVQFVGLLDSHGLVLEINQVALTAVGINLSDVEGRPFWTTFWWQVSEEINTTLRESIALAAKGEFVRWDTPIYGRMGGKETIIIDASLCPVKDELGNVIFICAEGRDITEKKAQEKEIAQKNFELEGLLERIRELDEIKTQFFANVSHELRTPLSLIIGPAERLLRADSVNLEEQRESVSIILRNARMLLKHVNDLLDISKLEAGKIKLELHQTDVASLIRFIASHFNILANERNINFLVEAPPSYILTIDPEKFQRVTMNILSNAFKFAPNGGTVRCKLELSEKDLILSIEDSGPGVCPALRNAIFERFRQGDGGANRRIGGTGLGLAIAHEFVEMLKGSIQVLDSDLGGALFQVRLPTSHLSASSEEHLFFPEISYDNSNTLEGLIEELRIPSMVQSPLGPDNSKATGKPLVLVVEDNPDMNRFIAQGLSQEYQVICAFGGQEGIEKAVAYNPALIVTDIMMPGVSGVQMIEALRKLPEMLETPILLLSAKADEELKIRLLENGAQDFVTKPFNERDLLVRVRNLIAVRRSYEIIRGAEGMKREMVEAVNRELQTRSQKLSELFEQAPSFMAVLRGPNHVFELANNAFYELVGHTDLIGKPMNEALPDIKNLEFIELLDRVRATGQSFTGKGTEILVQRTTGVSPEQRFVNYIYQPLFNGDKSVSGIFVEGHDVTDQKRAEEDLRLAHRRKDEFLATLAHELRNPLAPIRHAAMIGQSPDVSAAELKWSHEVIGRQVDHMGRLLDDLLDISRITSGKLELRKERLSLEESIHMAVETVRPLVESHGHSLSLEVFTDTVYIEADPVRFEQIFSNLLTNAAKYTDRGGVIRVVVKSTDGYVMVAIQDNGIGIAPELLPHIFEMFSQSSTALERSEGGLGIGLSLVRGLVLLHGGTVEARSGGTGKGSEFIVKLPLAKNEPQPVNLTGIISGLLVTNEKHLRILVVDDNRDNADLCSMLLKKEGYVVRTAYSGKDALMIAVEYKPQFILLDIGMSDMNGYEVARKIRDFKWNQRTILVAMTGWGQEGDKYKARMAGFDHHLNKPFNFNEIKLLLAEYDYVSNN